MQRSPPSTRRRERVAGEPGARVGRPVVHADSAHRCEPEWKPMAGLAGAAVPVG